MSAFALFKGFSIGLSMIIPIGAQNSYILTQGMKKNFHFTAATICIFCDILLMSIGVFGGSALIQQNEILALIITWGGISFLTIYGVLFFKQAMLKSTEQTKLLATPSSRWAVMLTTLAVTLLNPHVYLDTVMIIGSISGSFTMSEEKWAFLIGTCSASVVWFYCLSAGAAKLSPWLNKPLVQRIINGLIAIIMWSIAYSLL